MYEKLQQLAVKDGARTHHISQKVEVSPTVIKLVQFAFDTLAGIVPDTSETIPDNLPDTLLKNLPDKIISISDISDKRIESIVDRRLAELGILPDCQTEDNPTSYLLPDKVDIVPDNLPDNDVIISDKATLLPDNLPDTEKIPSDDSSNSDSIAEDVQIIQTDAIEQVSGEVPQIYSYSEFHKWLGIPASTPNKANGDIAITIAKDKGLGDWVMNSKSRKFTKFTKLTDNN